MLNNYHGNWICLPADGHMTDTYRTRKNKKKIIKDEKKLHGLSPRANYTDRATAACRRSECQRLWIEGATWSA
jgi:hypothetical protein